MFLLLVPIIEKALKNIVASSIVDVFFEDHGYMAVSLSACAIFVVCSLIALFC